jgi:hypothetical protein
VLPNFEEITPILTKRVGHFGVERQHLPLMTMMAMIWLSRWRRASTAIYGRHETKAKRFVGQQQYLLLVLLSGLMVVG